MMVLNCFLLLAVRFSMLGRPDARTPTRFNAQTLGRPDAPAFTFSIFAAAASGALGLRPGRGPLPRPAAAIIENPAPICPNMRAPVCPSAQTSKRPSVQMPGHLDAWASGRPNIRHTSPVVTGTFRHRYMEVPFSTMIGICALTRCYNQI